MAGKAREPKLDDFFDRFERRLPDRLGRFLRFVRQPSGIWIRIPIAIVFIAGGLVGFLPVVGFWMVPLGLLLIAEDIPFLQRPLVKMLEWIEARWLWARSLVQRRAGK